jgi:putative DNA-invertase from lambdoid prophage Rac
MKTILYCRVSSSDQTIAHQATQAAAAGFDVDEIVADDGVSGVSTPLAEREQGKRLFDMLRKGDTLVVRWIDRLGRNYADVVDNIRHFMKRGVVIKTVINGLTFDGATKDPMQQAVRDALIAFMAAMAQAQAEATKEAQRAGIAHAKANEPEAYRGRKPSFTPGQVATLHNMLANDAGPSAIAKATGLSRQTVHRIRGNPVWAEKTLATWADA